MVPVRPECGLRMRGVRSLPEHHACPPAIGSGAGGKPGPQGRKQTFLCGRAELKIRQHGPLAPHTLLFSKAVLKKSPLVLSQESISLPSSDLT